MCICNTAFMCTDVCVLCYSYSNIPFESSPLNSETFSLRFLCLCFTCIVLEKHCSSNKIIFTVGFHFNGPLSHENVLRTTSDSFS